jgi:hypothetical protein
MAITYAGLDKPERPVFLTNIDLLAVFTYEMHIGFCAATTSLAEGHYVLVWSFMTNGPTPSLYLTFLLPIDVSL